LVGHDALHNVEAVRGTNFADTYIATGFQRLLVMNDAMVMGKPSNGAAGVWPRNPLM
jgi:hypothetical protein